MLCEGCNRRPRMRGLRFCAGCRDGALARMERDGYLEPHDEERRRLDGFLEQQRLVKQQRGKSGVSRNS